MEGISLLIRAFERYFIRYPISITDIFHPYDKRGLNPTVCKFNCNKKSFTIFQMIQSLQSLMNIEENEEKLFQTKKSFNGTKCGQQLF